MILIISSKNDLHVDFVIYTLTQKNIPVIRLNTEDIPTETLFTWELSQGKMDGVLTTYGLHTTKLSEITACWDRRPEKAVPHKEITSPAVKKFIEKESRAFLSGLDTYLADRLWINYPRDVDVAENKMSNLRLAAEVGLSVPRTIITNNQQDAQRFFKACGEDVITKTLTAEMFEEGPELFFVYANRLTKRDYAHLDTVKYAPTQLQEYVLKRVELRVTVVGKKIFACEIHSQDSEKTKIDWRHYDYAHVKHLIHKLPKKVEHSLLAMLKKLRLNFGAFDMILTPAGEYVFLELNPNGQFYWIEQLTGMPITEAIANLLIRGKV